jgi:hypothetical protein
VSNAAFQVIRAHDRAEGDRIGTAYLTYVRGSTREFDRASTGRRSSVTKQRLADRELSRLESLIDT